MMLRGAGYKIIDLGIDVSPEKFVAAARDKEADVEALSALLTTTMIQMKNIAAAVRDSGLGIPVVIGAPATREYANEIQARATPPTPPAPSRRSAASSPH